MHRKQFLFTCGLLAGGVLCGDFVRAQTPGPKGTAFVATSASSAQKVLDQAGADDKITFIVFSKEDNAALAAMSKVVKDSVAQNSERAAVTFAKATNPADKPLFDRFDVSRAPMPLTLAVAPNGAVTGIFHREIKPENCEASLVTPTMTRCMKSLQENKLVFVCVQTSEKVIVPAAVKELAADAHFKDRIVTVPMRLNDPNESMFVQQMQLDPSKVKGNMTVILAPPGMLIGKYEASATKDQMAAALHKAGKCCDDPNCKHNQAASAPAPNSTSTKPQPAAGRRN